MPFKPGERVSHPLFGAGVVRAVSGDGDSARISVDFSPSVGSKKLLAGVAKLKSIDHPDGEECEGGEAPCSAPTNHFSQPLADPAWVEALDARFEPRGRNTPRERLVETLLETVRLEGFWFAVREELREVGFAPRVIDDLNEQVSFSAGTSGPALLLRLRIRHRELLKPDQRVLAATALSVLRKRYLEDFGEPRITSDFGTQLSLENAHVIRFEEVDLGELPTRDPKRRPLREQPKGVIRNRPRGWNDMR